MQGILAGIVDLVFPPRCAICSTLLKVQGPVPFCAQCRATITPITSPLCPCCGMPFSARGGEDHLCGECLVSPRPYDAMRSLGVYDGTLHTAIQLFKYHGKVSLGRVLGRMMADSAAAFWEADHFTLVMPVPLHKKRLQERGFNQSVVLAREIARHLALPLELGSLRRIIATAPQVGLGKDARRRNVRGAFAIYRPERIAGQRILLIDDVCTTGSTLQECAYLLRQRGAKTVTILTLARTVPDVESKEALSHGENGQLGDLNKDGGETEADR